VSAGRSASTVRNVTATVVTDASSVAGAAASTPAATTSNIASDRLRSRSCGGLLSSARTVPVPAAWIMSSARCSSTRRRPAASPFRPARVHAATERLLAQSGLPWTSLRNGFYANILNWLAGPWRETGAIAVPADGPVSWTAREDAAEAAAVVLASNGAYDGPITLTAGAASTFQDVAVIASELTGDEVKCVVVDPDEWLAAQLADGMTEFAAHFTLGMYQAAAQGRFAGVDPLLGELLGREPRTARDVLA
jgi:NAD(P)H dehydrogenase (quinone)